MADLFISRPYRRPAAGELDVTSFTLGSSSTASDLLEVRWTTGTIIRDDLLLFLEDVRNFVLAGGKDNNGTGVPPTSL